MAKKHDPELLNTLQSGFKYIENQSFKSTFQGLFSEINLTSEKLGKDYEKRNKTLCDIINKISKGLKKLPTDSDMLGDAYEYLIGQFASGSGKKAANFIHLNKFQMFCLQSLASIAKTQHKEKENI